MLSTLIILSFVASALAIDFTDWSPPVTGEVRSPCPGLNAMANHNILPHDGRGISVEMLVDAMGKTYNFGQDIATLFAIGALLASPNPFAGAMDLDNLDKHNFIEHDASLSRLDIQIGGDDHTFNQHIFNQVLAFYANTDFTSPAAASKARLARVQADAHVTGFTYGVKQAILGYSESSLYIMAMGNPLTGIAPVSHVKIFFEEERLPWVEGWRPPTTQITLAVTTAMMNRLAHFDNEAGQELTLINDQALAKAILGLDSFSKIPSYIQGLLGQFGLGHII